MLVVTTLMAACCGWFVVASRRARQQEEILALLRGKFEEPWIERWGPRWLDLFGAERYCQRIAGARLSAWRAEDQRKEEILKRLEELPSMRLLYLDVDRLSPATVEALNGMPDLRILRVEQSGGNVGDQAWRSCLAAIGRMSRLEHLCLVNLNSAALAELADLRRLHGLRLQFASPGDADDAYSSPPLLASLPIFPKLETLIFDGPYLVDGDLRRVAAQSNLKALCIEAPIIVADFAALSALDALEELTIIGPLEPADILALRGLRSLKALHICDTYGDGYLAFEPDAGTDKPEAPSGFDREVLSALRRARPGIVIDDYTPTLDWGENRVPPEYKPLGSERQSLSAPWLHAWFWTRGDEMIRGMNLPW